MTSAAILWASGRLLNVYLLRVVRNDWAGAEPYVEVQHGSAWGRPEHALHVAMTQGYDGVRMVDVETLETFTIGLAS